MSKDRETKSEALEVRPKAGSSQNWLKTLSRDEPLLIFSSRQERSLNTPEVRLAHGWITKWLNGTRDTNPEVHPEYRNTPESRERLWKLLAEIRRQLTLFEEKLLPNFEPGTPTHQSAHFHLLRACLSGVPKLMADYATVPTLEYHPQTKRWGVGLEPVNRTFPYGEVMAAHGIIELARSGCLDRLRTCECGALYFARKADGVACSDTCRKRIHDRKPEQIEKRRKRAKANSAYVSGKIHVEKANAKAAK